MIGEGSKVWWCLLGLSLRRAPQLVVARRDGLADGAVDGAREDGVAADAVVAEAPGDVFGCTDLPVLLAPWSPLSMVKNWG